MLVRVQEAWALRDTSSHHGQHRFLPSGDFLGALKTRACHSLATKSPSNQPKPPTFTGLLSNQGEKSINFYFIMVPLRKKY